MAEESKPLKNGRRLAEYFTPCFMLILQLRQGKDSGDPGALRQRIKQLLARVEHSCSGAGYRDKEIEKALFALVAFLDETLISPAWPHQNAWRENPLQVELYKSFNAGEEFFNRLEQMLRRPAPEAEVLEVYYLCMVLGFKGKYLLHQQEKLRVLISDTHKELRQVFDTPGRLLSPHGLLPPGRGEKPLLPFDGLPAPVWVYYAALLALGLLFYFGLLFSIEALSRGVEQIAKEIVPLTAYTR